MFNFVRAVSDWLTGNETVDTHNSGRQREEQPWENSWGQREERLQLFFNPSGAYIQADLARKTYYGEDNHPCNTDYSFVGKPCIKIDYSIF